MSDQAQQKHPTMARGALDSLPLRKAHIRSLGPRGSTTTPNPSALDSDLAGPVPSAKSVSVRRATTISMDHRRCSAAGSGIRSHWVKKASFTFVPRHPWGSRRDPTTSTCSVMEASCWISVRLMCHSGWNSACWRPGRTQPRSSQLRRSRLSTAPPRRQTTSPEPPNQTLRPSVCWSWV